MPKSSRHRSHRSRRHSVDPSESEDEEYSRERRSREEDPGAGSGARVSRDLEVDKRRASRNLDAKEMVGVNGELADEIGKKRKERGEVVVVSDRWISGEGVDRKMSRHDDSGSLQADKSEKSKSLSSDLKYRSSRRVESSGEVYEDGGVKADLLKRRSDRFEKDSIVQYKDSKDGDRERGSERSREREGIGGQNKDSKERERERALKSDKEERYQERGSEKDRGRNREAHNSSHEKVDDVQHVLNKNRSSKVIDTVDDIDSRKDAKAYEKQIKDLLPNSEMERGLEKHSRRRLDSEDKRLGDVRDKDDKRSSTRDDSRIRNYRDDRNENGKSRDELDNLDRDRRQREDKSRDEHSRDRASGRSERKYSRDENSPVDGRYRKSNIHEGDQYGSYADDRDAKYKESRGKKRSLEDNDDIGDLKSRNGRGLREETEKYANSNIKSESHANYPRSDYRHSDKRDTSPRNSRWKTSATSSAGAVKEHNRDPPSNVNKESSSEARVLSNATSAGHATATGVRERSNRSLQEKVKSIDDDCYVDICSETAPPTKYERVQRSDSRASPGWLEEKSPSKSIQRSSDRTGAMCSLDADGGEKNGSKDGLRGELFTEKVIASEVVQTQNYNRERTPIGSAFSRSGHSYGDSPRRLPPPSMRRRIDSPSALGSYEDESGGQAGDRRQYNRNKRAGDHSIGWGQGNAWKGGGPSWPSPVANGFIPLPHGPPPAAFHPAMPQFPGSPFFGVRPSMDLRQNGVPFHMPDIGDGFSSHGRQFGWHNTVDQSCPPHMQVWDGNNGAFRDESLVYGRPDWEPNRHLMGSRGWAMGTADMWKAQNKESEVHPLPVADEDLVGKPGKKHSHELTSPEAVGSKISSDPLVANKEIDGTIHKKLGPSKTSGEGDASFTAYYLSRIDISPDLADIELYKKSTSIGVAVETSIESNSVVHGYIQNVDDRGRLKMSSQNKLLGLPSLTAKDAIFEKAMALYSRQNEKFKYNLKASSEISLGEEKESLENTDNEKMQETVDEKMQETVDEKMQEDDEQANLAHADSSDIKKARNISAKILADNSVAIEHKSSSNSDEIIYNSGFQASEVLMEDCSANVNRIHHPPESTH